LYILKQYEYFVVCVCVIFELNII